jgi:signal transduction histidine kinase
MIFKSIRARLALSFAGIALVAAVALGAVLLVILQRYYLDLELNYLRGNAQAIGSMVMKMTSANAPHDELQSQIENLSFLTQTRIQVYGSGKQLLYDSGSPQNVNVNLTTEKQLFAESKETLPAGSLPIISIFQQGSQSVAVAPVPDTSQTVRVTPGGSDSVQSPKSVVIYRSIQVNGSPFGFSLNADVPMKTAHSNLKITEAIRDPQNNNALGAIQLSEGPAYGSSILRSVAWGWALASAIAVLLAAVIGWFISRRISAPVLALKNVTARMAQGDLSSRADVENRDELGQLARSFNEMADQVETTVTTLRRFASDAAHELRTPLTALRTNLDLALDEEDEENRATFLSRAQAMVQRMEELNSNLLDLSRLEATGNAVRETLVDLTGLLQQRTEVYASQAEQAELNLEVDLPAAPVLVYADASQITRAMDNLVDNACKFTAQGGTVHVTLAQRAGQGIFSVTDMGIGIPSDELPQLFNRFHRGRNTTPYPGSGLGLAIVKAIVTAHGGNVDVKSTGQGNGSTFSFKIPAVSNENS